MPHRPDAFARAFNLREWPAPCGRPDAEQLVRGRRGGAALMSGFYLMHRGWQEADISAREEYSRRDAWVWLIEACCFRLTDNENLAFASNVSGTVMRSEEHTSELQSLMRISYAVFCLQKKKHN